MILRGLLFITFMLLTACGSGRNYAPVEELENGVSVDEKSYVVSRGETLFSIAWSRNIDFKQLASTNRINPPYTIYPGQVLQLDGRGKSSAAGVKNAAAGGAKGSPAKRKSSTEKTASATTAKPRSSMPALDKNQYPYRWQWPAKGKLLRGYSARGAVHKGIDLQGKLGEPVYAANSGIVVYAGGGLKGYGNLLIVKHNAYYLSAYGHNSELLVKEGQKVKSGQQIAKIGDTGTNEVKLHFEIRRDGKPIDPLKLLPRK